MPRKVLDPSLEPKNKLPLSQALLWIFMSTLLVTGSCTMGWLYYQQLVQTRGKNVHYNIRAIVQQGEGLDTAYLAQLMELSADQPTNLYQFSTKWAENRLKSSPVIEWARVFKQRPDIIVVEYAVREPIAKIADYSNTLVDVEGKMFPRKPFFPEQSLPELYLGDDFENPWHAKVRAAKMAVFLDLMGRDLEIRRVDLSNMGAHSCGQREIVLTLRDETLLRLTPSGYQKELADFLRMDGGEGSKAVVDCRVPGVGLVY